MSVPVGDRPWLAAAPWLLFANVFRNLGLLAILILLARLTDGETVGRYALALAITAPIFIFAEFGLRNVFLTMIAPYRFSAYLELRVFLITLALAACLIIGAVVMPEGWTALALVALIKFSDSLADLLSGPLQKYHGERKIFRGYLVNAVAASSLATLVLVTSGSLEFTLLSLLTVSIVTTSTLMLIPALRLIRTNETTFVSPVPRAKLRRAIALAGLPVGISASLLTLISTTPQYFLAPSHGLEAVGRFAVFLYVVAAAEQFVGALSTSWIPRGRYQLSLSSDRAHYIGAVWSITARTMAYVAPLAIAGTYMASLLLPLIFGQRYAVTLDIAIPLMVGVCLLPPVFFSEVGLLIKNLYSHAVAVSGASALVAVSACAILIPPLGVVGALWSTTIALVARAGLTFIVLALSRPAARALD